MTVEQVDELTRRVQAKVLNETGVILTGVGVYSYNTKNDEAAKIRNTIQKLVLSHDWALQFHGFYVDIKKKSLRFGFVIVDSQKRGNGYGREMLNLAIRYGFEILKAEKITLGVFENNKAAYHCYRAAGFREVSQAEPEIFHILNEDWKCLELEIMQGEE